MTSRRFFFFSGAERSRPRGSADKTNSTILSWSMGLVTIGGAAVWCCPMAARAAALGTPCEPVEEQRRRGPSLRAVPRCTTVRLMPQATPLVAMRRLMMVRVLSPSMVGTLRVIK